MLKISSLTLKLVPFLLSLSLGASSVTYEFSGGRFGDCLLAYSRAKYFALKFDLDLVYKPFEYAEQLSLHASELDKQSQRAPGRRTNAKRKPTLSTKTVKGQFDFHPIQSNTLYVIPYFGEVLAERRLPWNNAWINLEIDWENKAFKRLLQEAIAPADDLQLVLPPQEAFSVAIHMRRGGNFDGQLQSESNTVAGIYCDTQVPLKFPPREYYVKALNTLIDLTSNDTIYVFLFTDDLQPEVLCEYLRSEINSTEKQIVFESRNTGENSDTNNVLEDFFSMLKFDALIRTESSYSIMISHLGNFKYEVSPAYQHWNKTISVIDSINLKINSQETL